MIQCVGDKRLKAHFLLSHEACGCRLCTDCPLRPFEKFFPPGAWWECSLSVQMSSLSLSEWLRPRPGHLLDATLSDAPGEGGLGGSRARNQRCSREVTHPFCSQHSSQNGANDPTGAETVGYLLEQHNRACPDGWRTQKVRNSVLQSREWGRVKIRQQQSIQVTGAWVTGSQMSKECVQTRVPQRPFVSYTLSSWLALPSTTNQAGPSSINLLPSPWDPH